MLDTATGVVRVANKQPGTDGPTGSQWEARRKPDQRARGARPAISYRTAGAVPPAVLLSTSTSNPVCPRG